MFAFVWPIISYLFAFCILIICKYRKKQNYLFIYINMCIVHIRGCRLCILEAVALDVWDMGHSLWLQFNEDFIIWILIFGILHKLIKTFWDPLLINGHSRILMDENAKGFQSVECYLCCSLSAGLLTECRGYNAMVLFIQLLQLPFAVLQCTRIGTSWYFEHPEISVDITEKCISKIVL